MVILSNYIPYRVLKNIIRIGGYPYGYMTLAVAVEDGEDDGFTFLDWHC